MLWSGAGRGRAGSRVRDPIPPSRHYGTRGSTSLPLDGCRGPPWIWRVVITPRASKRAAEELWEPRIGLRAARLYWWAKWVVWSGLRVAVATFILIAVPIWLHLGISSWWAWLVAPLAIAYAISGLIALLLARRAATKSLGIKVTAKNTPPGNREAYLAWCRRNGVAPFSRARNDLHT